MNGPPETCPPPGGRRGALLAASALVVLGTLLFIAGAVARLRGDDSTWLGLPALAVASAGFISTLAGGLWLRRQVGR